MSDLMTKSEKLENYSRVLEHDGWALTEAGWIIPGGLAEPMPIEIAFKVRTIFAKLDTPAPLPLIAKEAGNE